MAIRPPCWYQYRNRSRSRSHSPCTIDDETSDSDDSNTATEPGSDSEISITTPSVEGQTQPQMHPRGRCRRARRVEVMEPTCAFPSLSPSPLTIYKHTYTGEISKLIGSTAGGDIDGQETSIEPCAHIHIHIHRLKSMSTPTPLLTGICTPPPVLEMRMSDTSVRGRLRLQQTQAFMDVGVAADRDRDAPDIREVVRGRIRDIVRVKTSGIVSVNTRMKYSALPLCPVLV
jgi:hypothetical protein